MNVLITGANRGLGYQLLTEAIKREHHVIACVRNEEARRKLDLLLSEQQRQYVEYIQLDVKDESSIVQAAETLKARGTKLHSIINSAAVLLARQTSIEQLEMDDVTESFDVNLFGPIRMVKHFKSLLADGGSSILNISSEAGSIHNAYAGDFPYSLSKFALHLLSEQLKVSMRAENVQVWSIHPGWMKTDMGGENAPLDPQDSARGIIDIMERKVDIESRLCFINYKGEAMAI